MRLICVNWESKRWEREKIKILAWRAIIEVKWKDIFSFIFPSKSNNILIWQELLHFRDNYSCQLRKWRKIIKKSKRKRHLCNIKVFSSLLVNVLFQRMTENMYYEYITAFFSLVQTTELLKAQALCEYKAHILNN